MQAVILAAGKSTRTYPLTITKPKPLLKVANKTLIEHNLDSLNGILDQVIIVVGYKKDLITGHIGNKYKNIDVKYVEQKFQLGTAHAVSLAEPYIKDRFVLMMGDDIYSKNDIKKCMRHRYSILIKKVRNPKIFGVVVKKSGLLVDFEEKPKKFVSNFVNTACYCLDKKIFKFIRKIRKSERNELELPDAIKLLTKDRKVHCVVAKLWIPIGYPWDLLKADRILRKNKNIIGNKSKIYGNVENSSIGSGCIIKGKIKNSIIMDKTIVGTNSIVEDSVIGENVFFQGTILSRNNSLSIIKNGKIRVGRIGAIISDNVTAKNVVIEPGSKIWPNLSLSNKIIGGDVRL